MSKKNKAAVNSNAPNDSGMVSCALMFTGMIVMIACAIVGLVKLFTGHFLAALILFLIAAASFFLVEFVVKLDDKSIKKRKQEYRQKYITDMKVVDLELGELGFIHDSNTGELTLLHGIPALCGEGELEIEAEDAGMNTTPLIECAKRLVKDKEKIVKGMFDTVKDVYENEGVTEDDDGIPVDDDYILSRLSICDVSLSVDENGSWSARLWGSVNNNMTDHVSEHGLSAEFSNDSPDYDFYSG